jgi:hypothetical protein
MSVANIGDQPQNYFGESQKVIDASGRFVGDINPGDSIQVKARSMCRPAHGQPH